MNIRRIPVSQISVPDVTTKLRTYSQEFVEHLAKSISTEGLLQPILVRAVPEFEGKYLLVFGRNRLTAVRDILKWGDIPCVVHDSMDDNKALMDMISENVWRQALNTAQQARSVRMWHCNYMLVMGKEKLSKREENEFTEMVMAITSQSKNVVKRLKKLSKAFDEDELHVFDIIGLSQNDMIKLAKIKQKDLRHQASSLVGAGISVDEAVERVGRTLGPIVEPKPVQQSVKPTPVKPNVEKKTVLVLDDEDPEDVEEDWFSVHCSKLSDQLGKNNVYETESYLYKEINEDRLAFRKSILRRLSKIDANLRGPLWYALNRVVDLSHPKDWYLCVQCSGAGQSPYDLPCPACHGDGYTLKTEEYK